MKTRFATMCQMMALTVWACFCLSPFVLAQEQQNNQVRARFAVLPPKPAAAGGEAPATTLATWNGSFTYNGHQYNYYMVGADPSTNTSVTVPTFIIPIKIIINSGGHQYTFDPMTTAYNDALAGPHSIRDTVVANTVTSPIFDATTDYVQGGVDLGTTQYEDAYQRGNFWSIVQSNPNTHVLLGGPTVLPEQTLTVPAGLGTVGSPFGIQVGEVDINYFDAQISNIITQFSQIQPNTFPIFQTTNLYLTSGGCCIGGYHSANGPQSYAHFTYITHTGDFSQDVSALSHEVGEWIDDPGTNGSFNPVSCGILEVGDPLENGSPGHPYGAWQYPLHGFTYNLQDLVFLRYFGAPADTSVNSWWSFQNYPFHNVCQNGG